MKEQQVQQYLHEHIPISKAMGVEVVSAAVDRVLLAAPLEPNINHRETVFGGSASAVATLAAWTLLHLRLVENGIAGRLVIQRNSMSYEAPIEGAFTALCTFSDTGAWDRFMRVLKRRNRARITVNTVLECGGKKVAAFEGDFVAISANINAQPAP
jgi:thioesterase domain-containing protein